MAAKICAFERCNNTTLRGEKFCGEHNHINALWAEIERMKTLVPMSLRELKAAYGPELENLLSSLVRLLTAADPSKASVFGGGSPTARLKDAWAGQSQLDERGNNVVTHRGAATTEYARTTLIPRFKDKLDDLADDVIDALNPEMKVRRNDPRPRCSNPKCRWVGQFQRVDAEVCGKCGQPLREVENQIVAQTQSQKGK